jgi:hypothetical protein
MEWGRITQRGTANDATAASGTTASGTTGCFTNGRRRRRKFTSSASTARVR